MTPHDLWRCLTTCNFTTCPTCRLIALPAVAGAYESVPVGRRYRLTHVAADRVAVTYAGAELAPVRLDDVIALCDPSYRSHIRPISEKGA